MVVAFMYPASRIVVKPINWDVLLQPRNLQLGVGDRIFCRILGLSASMCALRDLLFTVVIH